MRVPAPSTRLLLVVALLSSTRPLPLYLCLCLALCVTLCPVFALLLFLSHSVSLSRFLCNSLSCLCLALFISISVSLYQSPVLSLSPDRSPIPTHHLLRESFPAAFLIQTNARTLSRTTISSMEASTSSGSINACACDGPPTSGTNLAS